MKHDKWAGARALALIGATVLLAIVAVIRFEDQLHKINWSLVTILCAFAVAAFAFYRWNARTDNAYDAADLFMTNGHADVWKHFVIVFGVISAWVIVRYSLAGTLTTEMLSLVLGIFIGKEAIGQIAVAIQTRPPAAPATVSVQQTNQPAEP